MDTAIIPLIIDGADVAPSDTTSDSPGTLFRPNPDNSANQHVHAVGANEALCLSAVESCAKAFKTWRLSQPFERRRLFNLLAQVCGSTSICHAVLTQA